MILSTLTLVLIVALAFVLGWTLSRCWKKKRVSKKSRTSAAAVSQPSPTTSSQPPQPRLPQTMAPQQPQTMAPQQPQTTTYVWAQPVASAPPPAAQSFDLYAAPSQPARQAFLPPPQPVRVGSLFAASGDGETLALLELPVAPLQETYAYTAVDVKTGYQYPLDNIYLLQDGDVVPKIQGKEGSGPWNVRIDVWRRYRGY